MLVLMQGESLQIPATVVGGKEFITGLTVVVKRSARGEIPQESAAVVATLDIEDWVSPEATSGYMFTLANTAALTVGIYYANYEYVIDGRSYKGDPLKIVVKESVV